MARIAPKKQQKSERDRLLEEGRIAARREMTQRFYARTDEWRRTHHAYQDTDVRSVGPG